MSAAQQGTDTASGAVRLLVGASLLEARRRHEFHVVLIFMAIYAVGVAITALVGIPNAATATFLLNLGLFLAQALAQIVTLLVAARQIPGEIETRTLYPLLAKPVTRPQYVVGKWLAATLAGVGCLVVLVLMAWVPFVAFVPRALVEKCHGATLLQGIGLQALALAALSAMAMLFSLLMPKVLNIVVSALIVVEGGTVAAFLRNRAMGHAGESAVRWFTSYIPDYGYLNLAQAYTDGVPALDWLNMAFRASYGCVLAFFCLALALWVFQRKPL